MTESFESIWDAIEDTPIAVREMKLRSELMIAIENKIRGEGWALEEAARRLDVTEQCVSDLMLGKLNLFGLDALTDLAEKLRI